MPGLKFRVLFDSVKEEEVFRDVAVNEDLTYEQLYMAILDAFELPNDQMASFFVSDMDWNKGEEISLMDMSFGSEEDDTPTQMSEIMIREKITSPRQRLILVHDFLSMFIFLIELQEILDRDVKNAELLLSVGHVPKGINEKTIENLDNMRFETGADKDSLGSEFDDYDDEFSGDNFENIDDFDI